MIGGWHAGVDQGVASAFGLIATNLDRLARGGRRARSGSASRAVRLRNLTGGDVKVRPCEREDVPAVLRLWSAARSGHASTPDRREDVEALATAENPAVLFVAEVDGHLIGAVIAGWDGWRGNVYRLAVRADHRRKGVGLRLTRAAEDYFRTRCVGRVTALVAFDDEPANGFWEAAGYPRDPEIGRRVRNI